MPRSSKFIILAFASAIALAAPGIVTAQTHAHDNHSAAPIEISLNNGTKWQGDQHMIKGMTTIRENITANLHAIHKGGLTKDAVGALASDIQKEVDYMVETCVLTPEADEQFHVILGGVIDGISALEDGETEAGAAQIVQTLNVYGEHFDHPGWQSLD